MKQFIRQYSMAIPLLAIATLAVSCNKSFDLQGRDSIGITQSYPDRPKTDHWESRFTDKFGFDMEGLKYEGYSYQDHSIFIFETTTTKVKQRKVLLLNPKGQVFELKAEEVELGNGIARFQNRQFKRATRGEHGRRIY